jgi:hypothetical protein
LLHDNEMSGIVKVGFELRVRMRRGFFITVAFAAGLAASPAARAAERVTLRNGFEMNCHHHVPMKSGIRLYLGAGQESYVDFTREQIIGFEEIPDPPPPQIIADAPPPIPLKTPPPPATDAKLSPADLHEMLFKAGHEHNLDVDLLACLVKAESGGNARAVSRAGARGLMQLMPGTASELGVEDSFRPDQNVRGGSVYLDALLTRYKDNMALALAAYNAGPAAVDKYHGIPPFPETHSYVARVIHEFNRRVLAREAQQRQAIASAATPPNKASR